MSLADFIDRSLKLDDADQLFQCYLGALSEYGVDRVIYSPVRNTPYVDAIFPGLSHSYPSDWLYHYIEHEYEVNDPVLQHGVGVHNAFTWREMMAIRDLSHAQSQLMNECEEAGLKDGLAVPLHGPMGEVYGIGMASTVTNPDVGHHLKAIQILSTQFHILYSSMHDARRNAQGVKLTPRELEVLKWCAAGKSNWAIGEILSISEHGVDFHMRNILRKLDADSRLTAVVKALHGGLISL